MLEGVNAKQLAVQWSNLAHTCIRKEQSVV